METYYTTEEGGRFKRLPVPIEGINKAVKELEENRMVEEETYLPVPHARSYLGGSLVHSVLFATKKKIHGIWDSSLGKFRKGLPKRLGNKQYCVYFRPL